MKDSYRGFTYEAFNSEEDKKQFITKLLATLEQKPAETAPVLIMKNVLFFNATRVLAFFWSKQAKTFGKLTETAIRQLYNAFREECVHVMKYEGEYYFAEGAFRQIEATKGVTAEYCLCEDVLQEVKSNASKEEISRKDLTEVETEEEHVAIIQKIMQLEEDVLDCGTPFEQQKTIKETRIKAIAPTKYEGFYYALTQTQEVPASEAGAKVEQPVELPN